MQKSQPKADQPRAEKLQLKIQNQESSPKQYEIFADRIRNRLESDKDTSDGVLILSKDSSEVEESMLRTRKFIYKTFICKLDLKTPPRWPVGTPRTVEESEKRKSNLWMLCVCKLIKLINNTYKVNYLIRACFKGPYSVITAPIRLQTIHRSSLYHFGYSSSRFMVFARIWTLLSRKRLLKQALTFILVIFALVFSLFPDFYRLSIAPKDTYFPLIHNNYSDYYYYLSLIRQGMEGKWFLTSYMTPEHFPPVFAQTFFALLGNIASIFSLSPDWIYFISRIILGMLLMLLCIYLINQLFKETRFRFASYLFVFFGTGFWTYSISGKTIVINQFLSFWTRFSPILRTTYLPHHLLSTILGILSLIYLAKALDKHNLKYSIIAGLFGLLSGFVYFATMVNIIGGVVIGILLNSKFKCKFQNEVKPKIPVFPTDLNPTGTDEVKTRYYAQNKHHLDKLVVSEKLGIEDLPGNKFCEQSYSKIGLLGYWFIGLFYLLLSSLSLLYLFQLSQTTFPWSTYNKVGEKFTFGITPWEYIGALGPAFILTITGLYLIFKSKSVLPKLLLGWSIFPFIGIFFLSRLLSKFGDVYFFEATSYIPLGILAVYGIQELEKLLKNKIGLLPGRVYWVIGLLGYWVISFYFLPPLYSSFRHELTALPVNLYNIYIPKEVMSGIYWLDKNTPVESVVLAGGHFGVIIPAFSHNRVVYGHPANTYNAFQKGEEVNLFFSQKDVNRSSDILLKYNVSYVFYSLDTNPPSDAFIKTLKLDKVYENGKVKIYKTKNR